MKPRHSLAALALLLTAAAGAPRFDWSQVNLKESGFTGEYLQKAVASQAACRANRSAEPPASDWPSTAERASLKGCDAEALYYGIGRPADPVAARKCALLQREAGVERGGPGGDYFFGPGILAMAYANGRGAARNLSVAIHMACGIDDAPAANEGRISELMERKIGRGGRKPFAICDDSTSGNAGGYCAAHFARLAKQDRARRIAVLDRNWSPLQRALFMRTYASFEAYAAVAHDLDCFGGTLSSACAIWNADDDTEEFLRRTEVLMAGKLPHPRHHLEGYRSSPATGSLDLSDVNPDQRPVFTANYRDAVAARAVFEHDLLAFMASTFPGYTRHRVRTMFRDL